ncbi:hypothetical protein [Roseateles oligotrophus]|uniref:Uncharacterized protein n=1 Tax=Roseateles oligotrophus TaxID=1769250 RepID=A0ABT2YMV5_9BURK|nr:hypothetical protein [Roseateles oligotrophus]MCV2371403.1 hypothetical protein [Roseateles oligotrophus]
MHRIRVIFKIGVLAGSLVGPAIAQSQPSVDLVAQPCPSRHAMRVAVLADGRIELNGKTVPVSQFAALAKLGTSGVKQVCLHRQDPEAAEPHPSMMVVLDALMKLTLPIAFYWDAQFQKRVVFKPQEAPK